MSLQVGLDLIASLVRAIVGIGRHLARDGLERSVVAGLDLDEPLAHCALALFVAQIGAAHLARIKVKSAALRTGRRPGNLDRAGHRVLVADAGGIASTACRDEPAGAAAAACM